MGWWGSKRASPSSALAQPLAHPAAPRDNGCKQCGYSVILPVIVYYFVAVGAALAVSYAAQYYYFRWKHLVQTAPNGHYTLPYMVLGVISAILASANASYHMVQHLAYNENGPALKVTCLVILSMVPVYAICSAVALCGNMNKFNFAVLLNAFREFYEAMVLIAFLEFIAEFWGGTLRLARLLDTEDLTFKNTFPTPAKMADKLLCCCGSFKIENLSVFPFRRAPGSEYVAWTYVGALQYAFVMLAYVVTNIVLWGAVFQGRMTEKRMQDILGDLKLVKAVSNLWAMFNLFVLFEYLRESRHTEERMNRIRPMSKFFCIKLIVLFSLWQEQLMTFLAQQLLLPNFVGVQMDWKDQRRTAEGAINFLVCLEMLLFAQWHRYAYPFEEKWDIGETLPNAFRDQRHKRKCCLFECGFGKLVDDVGYLLNNRVRGQHRCVRLLAKAKKNTSLASRESEEVKELKRLFKYFELDDNEEVSAAQLRHILVKSRLASGMEDAARKVEVADKNKNGRIEFKEFLKLAVDA